LAALSDYAGFSQAEGFPQTLHTPLSLMTPTQLPSLHRTRSEKSASSSVEVGFAFTELPHQQQKRLFSSVSPPQFGQSREGNASPQ
jgi:hypothetical protein